MSGLSGFFCSSCFSYFYESLPVQRGQHVAAEIDILLRYFAFIHSNVITFDYFERMTLAFGFLGVILQKVVRQESHVGKLVERPTHRRVSLGRFS